MGSVSWEYRKVESSASSVHAGKSSQLIVAMMCRKEVLQLKYNVIELIVSAHIFICQQYVLWWSKRWTTSKCHDGNENVTVFLTVRLSNTNQMLFPA